MIIGCPGSGKSTFARALHEKTKIPLYYLDRLYWNSDKTTVEKSVFSQRLSEILSQDRWIIDGNYSATMELRLSFCDTVFFLDYPTEICLSGVRERRGKPRDDMPWIETEEDGEFIKFIEEFKEKSRPKVLQLLKKYDGKEIHIFTHRRQADRFLAEEVL